MVGTRNNNQININAILNNPTNYKVDPTTTKNQIENRQEDSHHDQTQHDEGNSDLKMVKVIEFDFTKIFSIVKTYLKAIMNLKERVTSVVEIDGEELHYHTRIKDHEENNIVSLSNVDLSEIIKCLILKSTD